MSHKIYKLKRPVEYGGVLITEIAYDDDPDELTPAQLADIDMGKITVIGEITKSIAAVTKQPVQLIGMLKPRDWGVLANDIQVLLGNALNPTTTA